MKLFEAIEWTAAAQHQPALALVRTAYRNAADDGPDANTVNAALLCRDHLLGSVDARSLRLLRGLLDHKTDIVRRLTARTWAAALPISPHGIGPWARDIVLDFGP